MEENIGTFVFKFSLKDLSEKISASKSREKEKQQQIHPWKSYKSHQYI